MSFVTKVKRQLKSQPVEAVEGALRKLAQKGQPIRLLPEFVLEHRVKSRPGYGKRTEASVWVKEHGWPTGARFVRGASSGTYVYDPLGLDPLPPGYQGWDYPKPTFDDIVNAL